MKNYNLFVISGGPGTGKTSTINELSKKFLVLPEAAREVAEKDLRFNGKSVREINHAYFQKAIFEFQKNQLNNIKDRKNEIIFSDRWFGDTLAYYIFHNLKIPKDEFDYAKNHKGRGIFILDLLNFYEKDKLRQENNEEQKRIHNLIIGMYQKLGYRPIIVQFMGISERVEFILSKINSQINKK